jgi:hypothetical protein
MSNPTEKETGKACPTQSAIEVPAHTRRARTMGRYARRSCSGFCARLMITLSLGGTGLRWNFSGRRCTNVG